MVCAIPSPSSYLGLAMFINHNALSARETTSWYPDPWIWGTGTWPYEKGPGLGVLHQLGQGKGRGIHFIVPGEPRAMRMIRYIIPLIRWWSSRQEKGRRMVTTIFATLQSPHPPLPSSLRSESEAQAQMLPKPGASMIHELWVCIFIHCSMSLQVYTIALQPLFQMRWHTINQVGWRKECTGDKAAVRK